MHDGAAMHRRPTSEYYLMHGQPCLPSSIDHSGLEALLLISPDDPFSDLTEELEEMGIDPELLEPLSEMSREQGGIKYAPGVNVMAHLLFNKVSPRSEAVAQFVSDAMSCGYYLFNNMLFKASAGLKSTNDTLVVPLADGSVELIRGENIMDVAFDEDDHELTIYYDDDEGEEQFLVLKTGFDTRVHRHRMIHDADVGPVLRYLDGAYVDFRVIGHIYDSDVPMQPGDCFDWLLGLHSTKIDARRASSILTKCGFKRTNYLTVSDDGIAKRKTKPKAPDQFILAEIWNKGDINLYVTDDPVATMTLSIANDFVNLFGNQTKDSRYAATEDSVRHLLRPQIGNISMDGPMFSYLPTEDERNIASSDQDRLNAAEPLSAQHSPKITGVPALMRFAFDLLEADPEEFPEHETSARAVMAFAHTVYKHQTLRLNQSMRVIADDFITYDDDVLTIANMEFDLLNATFKADLSCNRLRLAQACGDRECDCVPDLLFIAP
jgi:hypothetical protein